MKNEIINGGAQFVIDAQKKRNGCNLSENNSYNPKRNVIWIR